MVPETKGRSLEEMEELWEKSPIEAIKESGGLEIQ
jgi:hypothetical protein